MAERLSFFSLARELRDRIYEEVLTTDAGIIPHPVVPAHVTLSWAREHTLTAQSASTDASVSTDPSVSAHPSASAHLSTSTDPISSSPAASNLTTEIVPHQVTPLPRISNKEKLTAALFLTNRQFHEEASPVLYSRNTFVMCEPARDIEWLKKIGQYNAQHLKSLNLITSPDYTLWVYLEDSNRAFWFRLLDHLARKVTGLRYLSLSLAAEESKRTGGYYSDGAGGDKHLAMVLGGIQGLRSMVIDGYYGEDWPGFLTEKMGVEVREACRGLGEWQALRSYQMTMRELDIYSWSLLAEANGGLTRDLP
ncbi:MAG: hypothetical protein Q9221_005599 [Calogaya cf. arnoldii]